MENNVNANSLNIKNAQDHPIKAGLASLGIVLAALWAFYRPALIEDLSADFVTKAEMSAHEAVQVAQAAAINRRFDTVDSKLGTLISKNNLTDAYSIIGGISADIDRHDKVRNNSQAWAETSFILKERLNKAVEYKDCIVGGHDNCSRIQSQIFQ